MEENKLLKFWISVNQKFFLQRKLCERVLSDSQFNSTFCFLFIYVYVNVLCFGITISGIRIHILELFNFHLIEINWNFSLYRRRYGDGIDLQIQMYWNSQWIDGKFKCGFRGDIHFTETQNFSISYGNFCYYSNDYCNVYQGPLSELHKNKRNRERICSNSWKDPLTTSSLN